LGLFDAILTNHGQFPSSMRWHPKIHP
jgi:hypothetical protein